MIDWLRRWIGPDRATRATLATLHAEVARLTDEYAGVRKGYGTLDRTIAEMLERPSGPAVACDKIRLRDRAEATRFARHVEQCTGRVVGALDAYRCGTCPRQPMTEARYWHIANVAAADRHGGGEARAARARAARAAGVNGTRIGDRIDPGILARIRPAP